MIPSGETVRGICDKGGLVATEPVSASGEKPLHLLFLPLLVQSSIRATRFLLGLAVGSSGLSGISGAGVKPSVTVPQHIPAHTHTLLLCPVCVCVCVGRGALEKKKAFCPNTGHWPLFIFSVNKANLDILGKASSCTTRAKGMMGQGGGCLEIKCTRTSAQPGRRHLEHRRHLGWEDKIPLVAAG